MVELARHEGARERHVGELVPQRLHGAGAHPSEGTGQAGDVVLEALGPNLRHVSVAAALEPGEHRQRPPVVHERLDAILLDPRGQRLVSLAPSLAGIGVESCVRADGQRREDAVGPPGGHMQGEPAAHRVADEVAALDLQRVPELDQVLGAGVHGAGGAMPDLRLAVAAEIGDDPPIALRHLGHQLAPAAAALCEAMQERHRPALAGDKVAQAGVPNVQNHDSIL